MNGQVSRFGRCVGGLGNLEKHCGVSEYVWK